MRTVVGRAAPVFEAPRGIAVSANGDMFIADAIKNRVFRYSAQDGELSVVAGTGHSSVLSHPRAIVLGPALPHWKQNKQQEHKQHLELHNKLDANASNCEHPTSNEQHVENSGLVSDWLR